VDPYLLVKFLHIASVIAAFVAAGILHAALLRLRAAEDARSARSAVATLARVGPKMPLFLLALMLTGGWLTQLHWSFNLPFAGIGIVGLLVMGAVSGVVVKPRTRTIYARLAKVEGTLDVEHRALVRDPTLWAAAHIPAPLAAGIVFDMVVKPGWAGSLGAVAVAVALGMVPVLMSQSAPVAAAALSEEGAGIQ